MSVRAALAILLTALVWPAIADAETLAELGPAPAFSLISQDRKPVTLAGLRGKVVAVTFIYTACPDICPTLTQKLVEVQDALGPAFGSKIVFVVITFDPAHDTPQVLKVYADAWEAKPDGWYFLTGPEAAVADAPRRYGVVAIKSAKGFTDHNLATSIVDARGVLRVQYLGMRFNADEFRRDLLSLVNPR